MKALTIKLNLAVPPLAVRALSAAALMFVGVGDLGSESVTLNTYYPAPAGVYQYMVTTNQTFLARDAGTVNVGLSTPGAAKLNVRSTAGQAVNVNASAGSGINVTAAAGMGLLVAAPGGFGTEPIRAQSDSTFFSGVNTAGAQRFALNNDGEGTASPALDFYGSDSGWFNFLKIAQDGTKLVTFPTGQIAGASGGSSQLQVMGNLQVTGAGGQHGYIHIDNASTGCYGTTLTGDVMNTACNPNYFITFTPGLYAEGYTYENRGGQVIAYKSTGYTTTQVLGLNPGAQIAGLPKDVDWMTLYKDDSAAYVWCCPK